jgi:hypothetical protein
LGLERRQIVEQDGDLELGGVLPTTSSPNAIRWPRACPVFTRAKMSARAAAILSELGWTVTRCEYMVRTLL